MLKIFRKFGKNVNKHSFALEINDDTNIHNRKDILPKYYRSEHSSTEGFLNEIGSNVFKTRNLNGELISPPGTL